MSDKAIEHALCEGFNGLRDSFQSFGRQIVQLADERDHYRAALEEITAKGCQWETPQADGIIHPCREIPFLDQKHWCPSCIAAKALGKDGGDS